MELVTQKQNFIYTVSEMMSPNFLNCVCYHTLLSYYIRTISEFFREVLFLKTQKPIVSDLLFIKIFSSQSFPVF